MAIVSDGEVDKINAFTKADCVQSRGVEGRCGYKILLKEVRGIKIII